MPLTDQQQAALLSEIKTDPDGRGYLSFDTDDPVMNVFNVLRDPSWARLVGDAPIQGLVSLGIAESEITPSDVRNAMTQARG